MAMPIQMCKWCHDQYMERNHKCRPDDKEQAILDAQRWYAEDQITLEELEVKLDKALAMKPNVWTGPVRIYC